MTFAAAVLSLWRTGHDTWAIADKLQRSEAEIANMLAKLRDGARR